jgi:hypothetical protein
MVKTIVGTLLKVGTMEQNFDYTMPFRNKTSEAGFQFLLTVVFN